jgi:hypothetical protein
MTAPGNENGEKLSGAEIGKDAVQSTIEAAASTVGEVATIVTGAVRDVVTALGGFATEVFEIREASRRAAADGDGPDAPTPAAEEQLDPDL